MRKFLLVFLLLILGNRIYALDIVYPKRYNVVINANSTFFIGSSKEPVKINGQDVPLHQTGAFAYVVNLKNGENIFKIISGEEYKLYKITKPVIKQYSANTPQIIKYNNTKPYYVTTDNTPLRSTPVDAGINRMAHLQRNVLLNIDGEKGSFYRVKLAENKYCWISKSSVKPCENYTNTPAKLFATTEDSSGENYTFTFKLDKTVPFEIVEGNPMVLKLYNIDGMPDNTLVKEFSATKISGYKGRFVGTDFVWEIRKPFNINHRRPLKNMNIAIDAGHGGSEFGAIGCLGDKEKDIVLDIAKDLEKELNKHGANVIMTRSEDNYLGLKERVDIANYSDAKIFISIHANALPDGANPNEHSGTSIYYYYNQAKPLADCMIQTITEDMNLNDDKVRQASFAVVRNTNALSILIETAYLINPEDNSKLVSPEFRKNYAKAIVKGLENYLLNY